jgi:predicted phage-related endonuclease
MAEELQAEMDSITDSIKAHMDNQGVDTLTGMDWKATYKTVTSSRVDTSALKKELPEIAQRFSKTTTTRRFCVA